MSDFGVKSSQIINILPIFGVSIQKNYVTQKSLDAIVRRPCRGRKPQRAESDRRRRLRDPLRQPGIRQQRFQRIADALQRPLHTPHRRGMDGEKPADLRRRPPAELRAAQRRPRTVPERRETADILPVQQQERTGQRRYLRPQGAAGRLFEGVLQRLDGVLPQPPVGFPRAL